MIAVLTDSCSLLLDDLDDHQEDDIREDEGGALPASHTMANNSRGLQAKLTTVSYLCFLKRTKKQSLAVHPSLVSVEDNIC